MRVDFIEENKKSNKIKVTLLIVSAIIFIACCSALGIYFAKEYKYSLMKETVVNSYNDLIKQNTSEVEMKNEINIDNSQQIKEQQEQTEVKKSTTNNKIPQYTAEAKEKMHNIYSTPTKIAYLTFDDGPSEAVTPLILDLLRKENIKATFFTLGMNVDSHPELVKREYEEGHYIANHGYTHNYAKIYKNKDSVLAEYRKTEESIKKALENEEYNSHLFRFPGGQAGGKYATIKKQAGKLLNENDISFIDWNCLNGDAEGGANTKEKLIGYIKKYSKDRNNLVILMHDAASKILTYETLPDIIEYLREEGYTFDNFYSIMQ